MLALDCKPAASSLHVYGFNWSPKHWKSHAIAAEVRRHSRGSCILKCYACSWQIEEQRGQSLTAVPPRSGLRVRSLLYSICCTPAVPETLRCLKVCRSMQNRGFRRSLQQMNGSALLPQA